MSRAKRFLVGVIVVMALSIYFASPGLKEAMAEREAEHKLLEAQTLVQEQARIDLKNKELMAALPSNCSIKFLGEFYTVEGYRFPTTMVQCTGSTVTTTMSLDRCGKSTCYRNVVSMVEN